MWLRVLWRTKRWSPVWRVRAENSESRLSIAEPAMMTFTLETNTGGYGRS
jgi:hypothetical protein